MTYAHPAHDLRPWPKYTAVVAHRGASQDAPEHTLAAYRKAIEDGADALECDVRLTADGHLVCVHDRRVNRTSNGRGAVSALELSDLAALDFGSWKGPEGQEPEGKEPEGKEPEDREPGGRQPEGLGRAHAHGQGHGPADPDESPDFYEAPDWERTSVLTLERLLELVVDAGRRVELAIETKHPTRWAGQVEERLLELLCRFGLDKPPAGEPAQARVMSFSARSLQRVHLAAPTVPTVYLMQFLSPLHRDGRLPAGSRIAGPSIRIVRSHPEYVARAHQAGHLVHVWTVDSPEDVELCARLGVDAVITNRPKQVLSQLGRSQP